MMGRIIENYSLQEMLGEGVYGKVYKAVHTTTRQEVAIKIVRAEKFKQIPKLQQFTVNEIKTLTKMEPNEHIVKYIDMLKTVNNFYFVYEYCNGGTLEKILQSYRNTPERAMPEKKALIYFSQIVDAFKTLTKYNIMHRDLKPDNILIHNGIIKLADFGFCKTLASSTEMAQTMLGSPIYMAPQVLKGEIYTMKADMWSLGVVLYQMLTGECPFQSNSIAKLIQILDNTQMNLPQNINPALERLLKRILVKDHSKRIDWPELFEYKITDSGDLIEPKINKSLTTSFGGYGYNSIVTNIQSQNNLQSPTNQKVVTNPNETSNKNSSFEKGFSPNTYQQNVMMRKRSPVKDIKDPNQDNTSKNFFKKNVNNPNQNSLKIANINNNSGVSTNSNSLSFEANTNNQKYDQMIKNHKKIIFVVQLAMDVIRKNTKDNAIVCYLIMKTVEKQLNELAQSLRKETDISSPSYSMNPIGSQLNLFKGMADKELQGLQNFMKAIKDEIQKLMDAERFQAIVGQRDKYLKSYIQGMKLENDPDQANFIIVSQVLDYFQQSILLKKDTYQRLTRQQLYKQIITKVSKL